MSKPTTGAHFIMLKIESSPPSLTINASMSVPHPHPKSMMSPMNMSQPMIWSFRSSFLSLLNGFQLCIGMAVFLCYRAGAPGMMRSATENDRRISRRTTLARCPMAFSEFESST